MQRRSFIRRGLAVLGVLAPVPLAAQGSVGATSGRGRTAGMDYHGSVLRARTPDGGSFPGTVIGILTPPMVEPTTPQEHGALWCYASGPADATLVQLKVNMNGNVLVLGEAQWLLQ